MSKFKAGDLVRCVKVGITLWVDETYLVEAVGLKGGQHIRLEAFGEGVDHHEDRFDLVRRGK